MQNNINKSNINISIKKKASDALIVTNLTFSYNKREDRVLFIINHINVEQRIDFFVTRRMMLQLLEAFDNILINNCNNGEEFKKLYHNQEKLVSSKLISKKEVNTSKNWEKSVNTKELNFTKTKEAILLDSLSYTVNKNETITFKFISSNKILAISTMDTIMFQRTLSSLMRVIPFISWGISPNILD